MNPIATLYMKNGSKIVIELLPESAPNTVNSFLYVASRGYMDQHAIERIVPGNWVDISYTAFGKKECRYLIPNEFELNPAVVPLDSHPGVEVNRPVEPQIIDHVELELYGQSYPEPVRVKNPKLPPCWE